MTIILVLSGYLAMGPAQANEFFQRPAAPAVLSRPGPPEASPGGHEAPQGEVVIEVVDVLGRDLKAKVELRRTWPKESTVIALPEGQGRTAFRAGPADAYVYVYDRDLPLLVDVQKIVVDPRETAYVLVSLLEGASGNRPLRAFDGDRDMAIDSAEIHAGTDPADAGSIPGVPPLHWESPVLSDESRWYRGELHAHSNLGRGQESVAQLVRRAEKLKLDFLAIADRNSLASTQDPGFQSDSMVLIPAMEWGYEERGVALIYGPRTFPPLTTDLTEAQGIADRVRAQGGIFAIAHPCFPTAPWQWGLSYVNAIEAWCRDWRHIPPMAWEQLDDWLRVKQGGKSIHSIALAAATRGHSANGQGALFWDIELNRGLKATLIGGSRSASPKVKIASPVTYIQAREKSVEGLLEGLRRGRTVVARDLDAPVLNLTADILNDGTMDVGIGGFVPLHVPTLFHVIVEKAKGKRLEILLNGLPIRSTIIPSNEYTHMFLQVPDSYSVFRARIVETPKDLAFGNLEMLAMTSPIYAQEVVPYDPEGGNNLWINIDNDYLNPRAAAAALPRNPSATEIKPRRFNN